MKSEYKSAVERAEWVLRQWEVLEFASSRHHEIGAGHAANLRGTLKNHAAGIAAIESLTSDLQFRLDCIARASGAMHEVDP